MGADHSAITAHPSTSSNRRPILDRLGRPKPARQYIVGSLLGKIGIPIIVRLRHEFIEVLPRLLRHARTRIVSCSGYWRLVVGWRWRVWSDRTETISNIDGTAGGLTTATRASICRHANTMHPRPYWLDSRGFWSEFLPVNHDSQGT